MQCKVIGCIALWRDYVTLKNLYASSKNQKKYNTSTKKNCARKKITELKFATWISQFAEIAKLNIANEQIFMGIAELKNAKY